MPEVSAQEILNKSNLRVLASDQSSVQSSPKTPPVMKDQPQKDDRRESLKEAVFDDLTKALQPLPDHEGDQPGQAPGQVLSTNEVLASAAGKLSALLRCEDFEEKRMVPLYAWDRVVKKSKKKKRKGRDTFRTNDTEASVASDATNRAKESKRRSVTDRGPIGLTSESSSRIRRRRGLRGADIFANSLKIKHQRFSILAQYGAGSQLRTAIFNELQRRDKGPGKDRSAPQGQLRQFGELTRNASGGYIVTKPPDEQAPEPIDARTSLIVTERNFRRSLVPEEADSLITEAARNVEKRLTTIGSLRQEEADALIERAAKDLEKKLSANRESVSRSAGRDSTVEKKLSTNRESVVRPTAAYKKPSVSSPVFDITSRTSLVQDPVLSLLPDNPPQKSVGMQSRELKPPGRLQSFAGIPSLADVGSLKTDVLPASDATTQVPPSACDSTVSSSLATPYAGTPQIGKSRRGSNSQATLFQSSQSTLANSVDHLPSRSADHLPSRRATHEISSQKLSCDVSQSSQNPSMVTTDGSVTMLTRDTSALITVSRDTSVETLRHDNSAARLGQDAPWHQSLLHDLSLSSLPAEGSHSSQQVLTSSASIPSAPSDPALIQAAHASEFSPASPDSRRRLVHRSTEGPGAHTDHQQDWHERQRVSLPVLQSKMQRFSIPAEHHSQQPGRQPLQVEPEQQEPQPEQQEPQPGGQQQQTPLQQLSPLQQGQMEPQPQRQQQQAPQQRPSQPHGQQQQYKRSGLQWQWQQKDEVLSQWEKRWENQDKEQEVKEDKEQIRHSDDTGQEQEHRREQDKKKDQSNLEQADGQEQRDAISNPRQQQQVRRNQQRNMQRPVPRRLLQSGRADQTSIQNVICSKPALSTPYTNGHMFSTEKRKLIEQHSLMLAEEPERAQSEYTACSNVKQAGDESPSLLPVHEGSGLNVPPRSAPAAPAAAASSRQKHSDSRGIPLPCLQPGSLGSLSWWPQKNAPRHATSPLSGCTPPLDSSTSPQLGMGELDATPRSHLRGKQLLQKSNATDLQPKGTEISDVWGLLEELPQAEADLSTSEDLMRVYEKDWGSSSLLAWLDSVDPKKDGECKEAAADDTCGMTKEAARESQSATSSSKHFTSALSPTRPETSGSGPAHVRRPGTFDTHEAAFRPGTSDAILGQRHAPSSRQGTSDAVPSQRNSASPCQGVSVTNRPQTSDAVPGTGRRHAPSARAGVSDANRPQTSDAVLGNGKRPGGLLGRKTSPAAQPEASIGNSKDNGSSKAVAAGFAHLFANTNKVVAPAKSRAHRLASLVQRL
eukprot:gnl/MRDRNA2_/MRDRNA2_101823_c0_seq1.p1 gnl/MRDRNA2_/MRDRNA2_101823_c0~~gnl/MRDRNA2_/MRDRNA2_101823_c0_seq1.p1  ORF type:complete len:1330 (-),score=274.64 gnl/MRDRNA2_/MRDRNA2_101823_c0_seq1:224-4090(-)